MEALVVSRKDYMAPYKGPPNVASDEFFKQGTFPICVSVLPSWKTKKKVTRDTGVETCSLYRARRSSCSGDSASSDESMERPSSSDDSSSAPTSFEILSSSDDSFSSPTNIEIISSSDDSFSSPTNIEILSSSDDSSSSPTNIESSSSSDDYTSSVENVVSTSGLKHFISSRERTSGSKSSPSSVDSNSESQESDLDSESPDFMLTAEDPDPTLEWLSPEDSDPTLELLSPEDSDPTLELLSPEDPDPTLEWLSPEDPDPTLEWLSPEDPDSTLEWLSPEDPDPTLEWSSSPLENPTHTLTSSVPSRECCCSSLEIIPSSQQVIVSYDGYPKSYQEGLNSSDETLDATTNREKSLIPDAVEVVSQQPAKDATSPLTAASATLSRRCASCTFSKKSISMGDVDESKFNSTSPLLNADTQHDSKLEPVDQSVKPAISSESLSIHSPKRFPVGEPDQTSSDSQNKKLAVTDDSHDTRLNSEAGAPLKTCTGSTNDALECEAHYEFRKKLSPDSLVSKTYRVELPYDSVDEMCDTVELRPKSGLCAKPANMEGRENIVSEFFNDDLFSKRFSKVPIKRVPSNYHLAPQASTLPAPFSPVPKNALEAYTVDMCNDVQYRVIVGRVSNERTMHSEPAILFGERTLSRDLRKNASCPSLNDTDALCTAPVQRSEDFTSTPSISNLVRKPCVKRPSKCNRDAVLFEVARPAKESHSGFNHSANESKSLENTRSGLSLAQPMGKKKYTTRSFPSTKIKRVDSGSDGVGSCSDYSKSAEIGAKKIPSPLPNSLNSNDLNIATCHFPEEVSPTPSFRGTDEFRTASLPVMSTASKGSSHLMSKILSKSLPATRKFVQLLKNRAAETQKQLRVSKGSVSRFQEQSLLPIEKENKEGKKLTLVVDTKTVYEGDEGERDVEYVLENGAQAASENFVAAARLPHKLEESMVRLHQDLRSGALVAEFETRYRINPALRMDIAKWSCNEARNRYRDISPYDKTRVVLQDDGTEAPFNDYINASYVEMEIQGTKIVNKYIASQGPLSTTLGHFWLMVWQQHCMQLVMLTTCIEQGRTKCRQYWPDVNSTAEYGAISVHCDEQKTKSGGFIWRQLTVKHKSSEEKRKIQHLQYVTWPDHGVPEQSNDFLTFVEEVRRIRAEDRENKHPVLVHCSAGIGRTGVLILMETSQCLIEANQPIIPEDLVMKMRDQRPMMIQTSGQFRFVCEAIHRVYDEKLVRPLSQDGSR